MLNLWWPRICVNIALADPGRSELWRAHLQSGDRNRRGIVCSDHGRDGPGKGPRGEYAGHDTCLGDVGANICDVIASAILAAIYVILLR